MLLGGAAAFALAATISSPVAAATQSPPAATAASANVLLNDWTGPYDGVPLEG